MRLTASAEITEGEIRRLIEELDAMQWTDKEELKRRIHLVARRYSNDADEVPESEPANP